MNNKENISKYLDKTVKVIKEASHENRTICEWISYFERAARWEFDARLNRKDCLELSDLLKQVLKNNNT